MLRLRDKIWSRAGFRSRALDGTEQLLPRHFREAALSGRGHARLAHLALADHHGGLAQQLARTCICNICLQMQCLNNVMHYLVRYLVHYGRDLGIAYTLA